MISDDCDYCGLNKSEINATMGELGGKITKLRAELEQSRAEVSRLTAELELERRYSETLEGDQDYVRRSLSDIKAYMSQGDNEAAKSAIILLDRWMTENDYHVSEIDQ